MKKVYRIISTILIAAMITSSLSVMAAPNYVEQTEEVLGTSVQTPAEPTPDELNQDDTMPDIVDGIIQIDDEQDLAKIGNDNSYPLDGEYILTTDITMTENFHPIGKEGNPFTGTFDGDGHVIYDLTMEEEGDNIGLFGVVSEGGVIKNIGVENGSVISEGLKVGGLVGWAAEATIENSYFVGDVSGDVAVGGVVGYSGQIGAFNTASTIKNCYQVGTVKGNNVVGGIEGVAASSGFSFSKMENCYHVGEIICAEALCGGLIGELGDTSYSFENSYYDIEQCGSVVKNAVGYTNIQISSSNIKGLTTEQMTGPNAFNYMIGMEEAYTAAPEQKVYKGMGYYSYYYPQLNIFINHASYIDGYPSIKIEDNNPSTISTAEELQKIGNDKNYPLDGNYTLTNDIDMSGVENFDPIGTEDDDFCGTFDGGGHVISNLNVDTGEEDYAGLFGCVGSGGTVKNLGVEGTVKGGDYVGGLVGWLSDEATLESCYFKGTVSGVENVGGLVGYSGDRGCCGGSSQILYCYHIGNVNGSKNVGGIVGQVVLSPYGFVDPCVSYCYNIGTFRDAENLGGIIGRISKYGVINTEYLFYSCVYVNTYRLDKQVDLVGENDLGYKYTDFSIVSIKGFSGPGVAEKYGLSQGYTSPPQQTSADNKYYYYPQLNCFVTDKNNLSQFPCTMNAYSIEFE